MEQLTARRVEPVQVARERGGDTEEHAAPDAHMLRRILTAMLRARAIDERMLKLQRQGRIGFHVGYRGEEAAIIAAAAALRDSDWIFPCYRELAALLWRGFPLQRYLDNMFGNASDIARGRQMPDHVTCRALAYASVSSPIGTQLTHAVGCSWASKLRGEDVVAAAFFGEGGTSSADFHSAANFAGVYKTPTIFLCRNNGWAISTPAALQTASPDFASKAAAYGMAGVRCDGNDASEVFRAVRGALTRARSGEGPTLIELVTYRQAGHSSADDPSVYRSPEELAPWLERDPIEALLRKLGAQGDWDGAATASVLAKVEHELAICIELAEKTAQPPLASVVQDVFAELPWHLAEQLAELEAGPRPARGHG
jgi:pyruvate dehydrogenase E1 component alpha subunit